MRTGISKTTSLTLVAATGWFAWGMTARADAASGPWYRNPVTNAAYRQEIVISGGLTGSALTNFPVLVVITNQNNPIFGKAQSDGDDIMFTSADGRTQLSHEIEAYTDSGVKRLVAWVKLPLLPGGRDTAVQMLYGNEALASQQNPAGVWGSDFLGVWHLNESVIAGETNYDSSASAAHATRYGSGAGGTAGRIAGGNAYNGADDHSQAGGGVFVNTNGFTVSAWLYMADTNNPFHAIEVGTDLGSYLGVYPERVPLFSVRNAAGEQVGTYGQPISLASWHHVVGVARPTYSQLFVDGVDVGATWGTPGGLSLLTHCRYIGGAVGSRLNGALDELRLCGVARSADWIKACYRNQGDPDAYIAFGPETGNGQWEFRQKIVIGASMAPNTDQTNFPVLVAITNQDSRVFAMAQADGDDILFTAADGTTRLAHETETYTNAGARNLLAWVKVPALSHTADTTVWMYYGNDTVSKQDASAGVWENAFLGVWHLGEAVSAGGINYDSSASAAHATRCGSGAGGAEGRIGGGNAFNGSDDFAQTHGITVPATGFTISAWVCRDPSATGANFHAIEGSYGPAFYLTITGSPYYPLFCIEDSIHAQQGCYGNGGVIATGNWHHYVATATPGRLDIYVDGVKQTHADWGADPNGISAQVRCKFIGCSSLALSDCWLGKLDELRLCGVPRSADWIAACYRNQSNPGWLTYGPDESRLPRGTCVLVR
ncbi:MAG: DUF2341 domain-containing protein [Kiritimatiellae bacterium]|nr:DUF2341 domain-containing protein [Kiritimatiellia bacterium]